MPQKLTEPQNYSTNHAVGCKPFDEQILGLLTQMWRKEGHEPGLIHGTVFDTSRNQAAPSASLLWYSHPDENHPHLPFKQLAHKWLMTFLNGPNRLFCVCDHAESLKLLDNLYQPQVALSPVSTCLIFWLLATGCRFSEDSEEHVYNGMYEIAGRLLDERINEETGSLIWLVQILLMKCIYWMAEKPKMCWVTLGMDGVPCCVEMLTPTATAIHIAETEGLELGRDQCPHLSDAEYVRRRQVWNAVIFMSGHVTSKSPLPSLTGAGG